MEKILYKLPQEFLEIIRLIYPVQYPKILKTFLSSKIPSFRVNLIKIDRASLLDRLDKHNVKTKDVIWYKNAFILVKPSEHKFQGLDLYKDGLVYFQNLSSMLPAIILNPRKNEKILDLCAAPGGKTLQLISESAAQIELLAVENLRPRFCKLLANLKNQGQDRLVKTLLSDGADLWKEHREYFDKVLIDVPCSSEAGFLASSPRTFSYWSHRKVKECQHRQKRLLFSGLMCLKKGGLLVYSTCTFSPQENEEVINWALDKFKDEIHLEEVKLPFNDFRNGLLKWRDKEFSPSIKFTMRIIPTETMEGFFIAKIRKK